MPLDDRGERLSVLQFGKRGVDSRAGLLLGFHSVHVPHNVGHANPLGTPEVLAFRLVEARDLRLGDRWDRPHELLHCALAPEVGLYLQPQKALIQSAATPAAIRFEALDLHVHNGWVHRPAVPSGLLAQQHAINHPQLGLLPEADGAFYVVWKFAPLLTLP